MNTILFHGLLLLGITAFMGVLAEGPAWADLRAEKVDYKTGDTTLEGYLAYDDSFPGKRPGIIVVHEWWGVTGYPKSVAEKLAKLGYVAFAVDMYGKGKVTSDRKDAAEWSGQIKGDYKLLQKRFEAGLNVLKENKKVDPEKIAAIGYCFGGTVVLEAARLGEDLAGVVSFHGGLGSSVPEKMWNVKAKLLVCQGADDPVAPPQAVEAFQKEMDDAGADWQFITYSGTVHSFTNPAAGNDPSKGSAYNARSAKRAWAAMEQFFKELFPKEDGK